MVNELPVERLRKECGPTLMRCETTEELTPLEGIIGQERAVRALRFGCSRVKAVLATSTRQASIHVT